MSNTYTYVEYTYNGIHEAVVMENVRDVPSKVHFNQNVIVGNVIFSRDVGGRGKFVKREGQEHCIAKNLIVKMGQLEKVFNNVTILPDELSDYRLRLI